MLCFLESKISRSMTELPGQSLVGHRRGQTGVRHSRGHRGKQGRPFRGSWNQPRASLLVSPMLPGAGCVISQASPVAPALSGRAPHLAMPPPGQPGKPFLFWGPSHCCPSDAPGVGFIKFNFPRERNKIHLELTTKQQRPMNSLLCY